MYNCFESVSKKLAMLRYLVENNQVKRIKIIETALAQNKS